MQKDPKVETNKKLIKKMFIIGTLIITIFVAIVVSNLWYTHRLGANSVKDRIVELEQKINFLHNDLSAASPNKLAEKDALVTMQINDAYILACAAENILHSTRDLSIAKQLLQLASRHLETLHSPKIDQAKEILAADQAKLAAATMPDIRLIQEKLSVLDKLINVLPAYKNVSVKNEDKNDKQVSIHTNTNKTFYQKFLHVITDIKSVVKVRKKNEHEVNALVTEVAREQFKLLIEQARWAAFYNNAEIYQHSLNRAQALLPEIFDVNSDSVQKCLVILRELAAMQLKFEMPNIQDTVNALHAILIG